jgi:hypothetical protein
VVSWARRHASFANVVSLIALFVSLGGGAYAFTRLPPNSIGAKQLKGDSVGASELRANSTGSSELRAGAVKVAELAHQAVTADALAPSAVTPGALADNAVTNGKLAQSSVGPAQVQDGTLAPQEFTENGLPEVGYSSRELGATPESVPQNATNAGVLNLDIPAGTSGYTTSSGVVGAVAPSRLVANAQVVLRANVNTMLQCRLSRFHAGVLDQVPFAAGTNATGHAGDDVALPLAGGLDVEPGSYNIRVQCFTSPSAAGSASFVRGSLTVSIAPR